MRWLGERWPRVVEMLLAPCLAIAPWLLGAPLLLRMHDLLAALVMLAVTGWSTVLPERRLNLWNLLVGGWLAAFALFYSRSLHEPTAQSELLVGLSLAMFAIIPSRTMQVPADWLRFFAAHPQAAEQERHAVNRHEGRREHEA